MGDTGDRGRYGADPVCATPFQPGVDPLTFPADYASYAGGAVTVVATHPHTAAEPALAPYVWATAPPSS
jgi:hypothetical protein